MLLLSMLFFLPIALASSLGGVDPVELAIAEAKSLSELNPLGQSTLDLMITKLSDKPRDPARLARLVEKTHRIKAGMTDEQLGRRGRMMKVTGLHDLMASVLNVDMLREGYLAGSGGASSLGGVDPVDSAIAEAMSLSDLNPLDPATLELLITQLSDKPRDPVCLARLVEETLRLRGGMLPVVEGSQVASGDAASPVRRETLLSQERGYFEEPFNQSDLDPDYQAVMDAMSFRHSDLLDQEILVSLIDQLLQNRGDPDCLARLVSTTSRMKPDMLSEGYLAASEGASAPNRRLPALSLTHGSIRLFEDAVSLESSVDSQNIFSSKQYTSPFYPGGISYTSATLRINVPGVGLIFSLIDCPIAVHPGPDPDSLRIVFGPDRLLGALKSLRKRIGVRAEPVTPADVSIVFSQTSEVTVTVEIQIGQGILVRFF